MEVCGTHTVAISKNGIRGLLPKNIRLISGPGCPVCVTPDSDIDLAIELSKNKNNIIVSFGDMLRVPGSNSSLEKEKIKGANVEIIYSPLDSLDIAENNPKKEIIFVGVGFETTSPLIAVTVKEAIKRKIKNFSVLSSFKLVPPALKYLLAEKDIKIDGLLLPGHASVIIGANSYDYVTVPSVISGFSGPDIMQSIEMLIAQIMEKRSVVENQYCDVVTEGGNIAAQELIKEVFEEVDSDWRGIGKIAKSGLALKKGYEAYDAVKKFSLKRKKSVIKKGCECGNILKGIKTPPECKLFRKVCTPSDPIGPCMVSSEGSCSAYYKYEC